jgi:hypothetical protein
MLNRIGSPVAVVGLVMALNVVAATPAAAQATVTQSDIQRLQDRVFDASTEVSRVRARNADSAVRLQEQLDELREEVIYLKVKLRKEGSVSRSEYAAVRDRIDDVAARARGEAGYGSASSSGTGSGMGSGSGTSSSGTSTYPPVASSGATSGSSTYGSGASRSTAGDPRSTTSTDAEVPVGTELDVRLQTTLNSGTSQVEQRFEATTVEPLRMNGNVLIPAGSIVRGVVSDVKPAGRLERKGSLTLSFDQISIRGRNYPIRGTIAPFESEGVKGDAAKIGTGAGVGAIIGGILGGFKGALAGILIGGGGVVAATEGQDVNLPSGTVLRMRLDTAIDVQ